MASVCDLEWICISDLVKNVKGQTLHLEGESTAGAGLGQDAVPGPSAAPTRLRHGRAPQLPAGGAYLYVFPSLAVSPEARMG